MSQAGQQAVDSPGVVAMQQDLGIGVTPESVTERLEVPEEPGKLVPPEGRDQISARTFRFGS